MQRHCGRNEQRIGGERTENALAELPGRFAVGRQLFVLLYLRRLGPSGGSAVLPGFGIDDAAEVRHIIFAKDVGDADQHAWITYNLLKLKARLR